jgi:Rieske Fe-S protein
MPEDRRTVLKVLSGVLGTGCAAAIGVPVLGALTAPAVRVTVKGARGFVPVLALEALPLDGTPVGIPVVVEAPEDAWSRLPPTEVGAVYLRRLPGEQGILAFTTVCPHLGCRIDYQPSRQHFVCPCHESVFGLDGQVTSGPSPRGMDDLGTRVVGGQIEVEFMRFKTGTARKVEV